MFDMIYVDWCPILQSEKAFLVDINENSLTEPRYLVWIPISVCERDFGNHIYKIKRWFYAKIR